MEIKKIAILTSGGDAPGMNASIRAFVRSCKYNNIEPYGIFEGYKGLCEKNVVKLTDKMVDGIESRGGTILYSARFPQMQNEETRIHAAKVAKELGVDAIICVGGDGTYMGAYKLSLLGVPCVGIPGTIDNDVMSTDRTIGFDTALTTIVNACDQLVDTGASHHRCMILEVMGRNNPDLAIRAGIACGASYVVKDSESYSDEALLLAIKEAYEDDERTALVVVCEHTIDVKHIEDIVNKQGLYEAKANILGHVQRGGKPTPNDRILASRLTDYAITLLKEGKTGICVGTKGDELIYTDIIKANEMPKSKPDALYEQYLHLTK